MTDLFALMTAHEIEVYLVNHQQYLQSFPYVDALLKPAGTVMNAPHLTQWFAGLDVKINRSELTPLIEQLDEASARLKPLIQLLNAPFTPLKKDLQMLVLQLDEMAHQLMKAHLNGTPVHDDALEEAIGQLHEAYQMASKRLSEVHQEGQLAATHLSGYESLEQLLWAESKPLLEQIQEVSQAIDKRDAYFSCQTEATLLRRSSTKDLLPLFQPQALPTPSFAETIDAHFKSRNREQFLFLKTLMAAIARHPEQDRLLEPLIHWHLNQVGSQQNRAAMLNFIAPRFEKAELKSCQPLEARLNEHLDEVKKVQPLLIELGQLSLKTSLTMMELVQHLAQAEAATLHTLIQLSEQAGCMDLVQLLKLIGVCQEKGIPVEHYLRETNQLDALPWLEQTLTALHAYSSHRFSLCVLLKGVYRPEVDAITRLNEVNQLLDNACTGIDEEAILLLVQSYQPILEQGLSTEAYAFLSVLNQLMQKATLIQQQIIAQLPAQTMSQLMAHCLSGISSSEASRVEPCKGLLTCFTQLGCGEQVANLQIIKERLGACDLTLLAEPLLIEMAQTILASVGSDLDDTTLNGVWIQRLITSPLFMAACPPEQLQQLIERYRLISLTLKQDEFQRLNHWIKGQFAFDDHHQRTLATLQEEMTNHPERRAYYLAKRERLLKFQTDDAIRALLNQLEDHCFALRETDATTAENALDHLYSYYHQRLSSLRSDLLFNVADFIYTRATAQKGDIEQAQSTLFAWLKRYLPHQNFEQQELSRKKRVALYDAQGKKIGFITESNHAIAFHEDMPCSLLTIEGMTAGMALYDKHRQRTGTLTATGEVKRENLFQKNTSALLIGKVDCDELAKSSAALDLLLHDVLVENALETLYGCEELQESQEKRLWVEQQVNQSILQSRKPVQRETLQSLMTYHANESVLHLLEATTHEANAHTLFNVFLLDEQKRFVLFEQGFQAFDCYLRRFDAQTILADYIEQHHTKPWFIQGLTMFAQYANVHHASDLFNGALGQLSDKLSSNDWNAVLHALLSTEQSIKLVLYDFLNINEQAAIQDSRSTRLDQFTRCLGKVQLMPLIEQLNKEVDCQQNAGYRLVLSAFAAHHQTLFKGKELRLSRQEAWQAQDLSHLTTFVRRHLHTVNNPDKGFHIGQRLLSELTFRTANFGQTHLFYSQGNLDDLMVNQTLKRNRLNALAARIYLPDSLKDRLQKGFSSIKGWFDSRHAEKEELVKSLTENQAIMDWKQMANDTWTLTDGTQLPILCAYLMNYSGPTSSLVKLLQDYKEAPSVRANPAKLHQIAQLMAAFPQRDVSAVIFRVLSKACVEQPALLDAPMLTYLAQFHSVTHLARNPQPLLAEYNLIKHFGQQKHYALVTQSCHVLHQMTDDLQLKDELKEINTVATLEQKLLHQVNSWYFGLVSSIRRWWNYGNNPKACVKFCDDLSVYPNPERIPQFIKTPVLAGQVIEQQLKLHDHAQRARLLKARFEAFTQKEHPALEDLTPSLKGKEPIHIKLSEEGFFQDKEGVRDRRLHADLATSPVVAGV